MPLFRRKQSPLPTQADGNALAIRADPAGGHCGLLVASRGPLKEGELRYESPVDCYRFVHAVIGGWNLESAEPSPSLRHPQHAGVRVEEAQLLWRTDVTHDEGALVYLPEPLTLRQVR